MQFDVDIEKLIDTGLTINDYLFCQFIYNQNEKLLGFYTEQFDKFYTRESIDKLIMTGFLELEDDSRGYRFTNFRVTEHFIELFLNELKLKKATKTKSEDELPWFDEWYSLWPRGQKSGGYPVKGDRKGCYKKLIKFIKEHPEFEKDIIIKATKDYIDAQRLSRFAFIKLAHFFVYKDNISVLASYCELIKEKLDNNEGYDINSSDDNLYYDNIDDI